MSRQPYHREIIVGIVVLGVAWMIVLFNIHSETVTLDTPEIEYPPPMIVYDYTPSECVVDVSNYTPDGQRSYGQGVIVKDRGKTFVLTSSMIFTHEGDIMINHDVDSNTRRVACDATIIHQNDNWGLVALDYYFEGAPSIEINEFPNHPTDAQVLIGDQTVNTLKYMNDDWVILDGNLPPEATGMPAENDGELVGIIVGLNKANQKQAIMVGNRAIKEFVYQISLIDDAGPPPVFHLGDE